MITKEEILELSQKQSANCVSIFIPTHRAGEEVLSGKDVLKLKNQLKKADTLLETAGVPVREREKLLEQATRLIGNDDFWKDQSDGLAIFISDNHFSYYTVPVYFEEYTYVGNEFYLKPLMPLTTGNKLFYILSLKTDEVKMYEGEPYSITDIQIDDVMPTNLRDRVGYDYEEKHVQTRSQQGNAGQGLFHGHGDAETDHKEELLQFFKAIDNGVMKIIGDDQSIPLVLACQDSHAGIYKHANHYNGLWEQHISGNPSDKDIYLLHEEAVETLEPYFNEERTAHHNKIKELLGTGKAASDTKTVLNKALQGLVDAVFIENRAEVFGTYDLSDNELNIEQEHTQSNVSLLNLIATKVLEQGGSVYLVEKDDMPDSSNIVTGLFRG